MASAVEKSKLPSLYDLEESLTALLDTEAMVTAEQEEQFRLELSAQLEKTVAKRDRVGAFIQWLKHQAGTSSQRGVIDQEIDRLRNFKRICESTLERLENYVLGVIEHIGPDDKGKLRKLQGEQYTLSARACPVSVSITDDAAVPDEYKRVTVTMPALEWMALMVELGVVPDENWSVSTAIDRTAVKEYLTGEPLQCGECGGIGMVPSAESLPIQCKACGGACTVPRTVAGADLVIGKISLQVK